MQKQSRRSFIAASVAAAAVVTTSGIIAVSAAGMEVTPELAKIVRDLEVARRNSAAAEAAGDEILAERCYEIEVELEEAVEAFEVHSAGDLVELAQLAKRQIADGGLTFDMPDALVNGILRLFGQLKA